MIIGWTGHRNRITYLAEIADIHLKYPDADWYHGDAIGFDTQVKKYAQEHGILEFGFPPEYWKYPNNRRYAPIARNHEKIVKPCDLLVACWDGRTDGGTYDTIQYALELNKPVLYVTAINIITKE